MLNTKGVRNGLIFSSFRVGLNAPPFLPLLGAKELTRPGGKITPSTTWPYDSPAVEFWNFSLVAAILSLSPPILKDSAMLLVRQGVINKAEDFALSMVLFGAEEQEEEYVKTIARWGMGSCMPHDLYFFLFFFCLALSKGRLSAKGWANAEREFVAYRYGQRNIHHLEFYTCVCSDPKEV